MSRFFEVIETFQITGRGLVVVLPARADAMPHASPLSVIVRAQGHSPIQAKAFHELILRRTTEALESSGLLLVGLKKSQVPIGSVLEVESIAS